MRTDRRRRSVLTGLVLVSLFLVTLDYRSPEAGPLAGVQRAAAEFFDPLQRGIATVVRPVGAVAGSVTDLGSLQEDKERLERENALLREQLGIQEDLEQQLAEVRAELDLRNRVDLELLGAEVIAQTLNPLSYGVVLDKGADDGIEPGMAVVNSAGLVGKIVRVTPGTSQVELLTDPDARYNVRIAETGEQARLQGAGSQPFRLELLQPQIEIEEGQQVVTRTSGGSRIPDGIGVGVLSGGDNGTRYRPVTPFVDFSRLNVLQVVMNAPTPPDGIDPGAVLAQPRPGEGERPPPPSDEEDGERPPGSELPSEGMEIPVPATPEGGTDEG